MTVTKSDIVNYVENKCNFDHESAVFLVENFFEEIKKSLENGDSVKISGFGTFQLRTKAARPGRNPKTGQEHVVSGRNVVSFRSGNKIRSIVKVV